jgi:hypothetical protein
MNMKMNPSIKQFQVLIACGGILSFNAAPAASPAGEEASNWTKPAWLTDAGLTIKESYEDNVLMSGVNQSSLPAGMTTLKDQSSAITTVSPKVGVNVAGLLDAGGDLEALSLTYAPDFVLYHALPSENYDAHRLVLALKGKADAFSYDLDNTFLYVDASRVAPAYPGDLFNAWATINAYQRREQVNDRSKLALQYDWGDWFVRPGASLAYYGMMTEIKNPSLAGTPSGYQDYATRYDVNGGTDLGYKFSPGMAATLGYRYGSQGQEQYSFNKDSSPSDYQRVLAGVEGKPLSWLNVQALGGPDFRSYEADSTTHTTPLNNLHPLTYYGEAALTAAPTPADTVGFKYKQYQFVSCLGVKPYFDSSYALTYGRKLTERLSLEAGAKVLDADYTVGNLASCKRNDLEYVVSAGLHFVLSAHFAADNISNTQTRDFNDNVVSLGMQFKL